MSSELDFLKNRVSKLERQVSFLANQNLTLTQGLIETLKLIRNPDGESISEAIASLRTLLKAKGQ